MQAISGRKCHKYGIKLYMLAEPNDLVHIHSCVWRGQKFDVSGDVSKIVAHAWTWYVPVQLFLISSHVRNSCPIKIYILPGGLGRIGEEILQK